MISEEWSYTSEIDIEGRLVVGFMCLLPCRTRTRDLVANRQSWPLFRCSTSSEKLIEATEIGRIPDNRLRGTFTSFYKKTLQKFYTATSANLPSEPSECKPEKAGNPGA